MRTSGKICFVGIAVAAAFCTTVSARAEERITVTIYSGVWGASQTACILDPFTKETGITVVPEPGVSTVTLNKLIQEKDDPAIDVSWIDSGIAEQAWAEGVLQAIDPSAVPNIANMAPQGVYKTKDGQVYSLSTGFYATGILYNTKEVKEKPTSWMDLWKPEYANRVIFPGPAQAIFLPTFMHINTLLGGNSSNFEPAIEKFRTLKPSSYYESTGVIQASIQSGEAIIGAFYVNNAWALTDQGLPVAAAIPKEGVPAGDIRVELVKGTKHKEAALKFINKAVSPEALNCLAEKLYVGPPLKSPKLSDNAKQRMPWGADGSIANLVIPDWNVVNAKRAEIIDLWNRKVVGH